MSQRHHEDHVADTGFDFSNNLSSIHIKIDGISTLLFLEALLLPKCQSIRLQVPVEHQDIRYDVRDVSKLEHG